MIALFHFVVVSRLFAVVLFLTVVVLCLCVVIFCFFELILCLFVVFINKYSQSLQTDALADLMTLSNLSLLETVAMTKSME